MTQWGSWCSIFSFLCSVLQIIVLLSLSFGHCIVVPSSIYGLVGFVSLFYFLTIVLFDLQFSVQCFVDHCLYCCLFLLAIVLSFLLQFMAQWGLCCSIFSFLCSVLQIIFLLSLSFGHCIVVPSSIYGLVGFVLFDLQFSVQCFVDHCLSCCPFLLLIVLSFLLHSWLSGVRVTRSLVFCVVFCRSLFILLSLSFGHCIVVPSSIYGLVGFVLLDLQFSVQCFVDHCLSFFPFLLAIVLSFLLQSMAQWGSCFSIFSFLCSVLQIIVCLFFPFF